MTGTSPLRMQADGSVAMRAPVFAVFPEELRRGIGAMIDWTVLLFVGASLCVHFIVTGVIASREWPDPTRQLSETELLDIQRQIVQQYQVSLDQQAIDEVFIAAEGIEIEAARLEGEIAESIAAAERAANEAAAMAEDLSRGIGVDPALTEGLNVGDLVNGINMAATPGEMTSAPDLAISPVDLAVFADVRGAHSSRVVAMAVDASLFGGDTQISSRFVAGGVSGERARRLEQEIRFATERLGGDVRLRIGTGEVGQDRRDLLRIRTGSRQGQRIGIEQMALPPAVAVVPGGRDQHAVEAVAARTRELVAGCYAIGLADDPTLMGVAVVRFTVNADGSVSNVAITRSSLVSPAVEECLMAAVTTWRFAPGGVAETFEYPFTFEPG